MQMKITTRHCCSPTGMAWIGENGGQSELSYVVSRNVKTVHLFGRVLKVKHTSTPWLKYLSKRDENNMCKDVGGSSIDNGPKPETPCMTVLGWANRGTWEQWCISQHHERSKPLMHATTEMHLRNIRLSKRTQPSHPTNAKILSEAKCGTGWESDQWLLLGSGSWVGRGRGTFWGAGSALHFDAHGWDWPASTLKIWAWHWVEMQSQLATESYWRKMVKRYKLPVTRHINGRDIPNE